ncbi:MAG: hypothetical protein M2R45_03926 [Verrucomicrobia subdivision 3 bacterium]|nr:hypothetical protein [Limisphaerales bacterium]MCS1417494.1 hypothetical protein [Limisphaerales bacterium]
MEADVLRRALLAACISRSIGRTSRRCLGKKQWPFASASWLRLRLSEDVPENPGFAYSNDRERALKAGDPFLIPKEGWVGSHWHLDGSAHPGHPGRKLPILGLAIGRRRLARVISCRLIAFSFVNSGQFPSRKLAF